MKPVVVVTVYRRYFELRRCLERVRELRGEFSETPTVAVVWACPEVGRLWFFRELTESGLVDVVLTRQKLPDESPDRSTTYPESHNIRVGLEWVRANFDNGSTYAVVMAADILPSPEKAFRPVDFHMSFDSGQAAVFHWANGCVSSNIWHTNFFAVGMDPRYWPPVIGPDSGDTLEWAWGKQLMAARLHAILEGHNSREQKFTHAHLSEYEPPWPVVPESSSRDLLLLTEGYQSFWRRLGERLRLIRPFRRTV